jgi:8-oxo-dGTP pyrophosphatase MutT (NUDIX family)
VFQPHVTSASGRRQFACSPVALMPIIIDPEERILLLASPTRRPDGAWQLVSGALEAGETVLEGVLRETHEEAGSDLRVRPLGAVHVHTFYYDQNVPYMIGIYYLLAYESGQVQPGDDMRDSQFRWWRLEELAQEKVKLFVPPQLWVLQRAIELYRLWKEQGQIDIDLNL